MLFVEKPPCFTCFHLRCIWSQNFPQKQSDGTWLQSCPRWKPLWIIHGLPVTDCMTAASTGITRLISIGFPQAWTRAHMWKYTHNKHPRSPWLGEGCSAREGPGPLLAGRRDRLSLWLFQGVGEKRLWWLRTSAWSLFAHCAQWMCSLRQPPPPRLPRLCRCFIWKVKASSLRVCQASMFGLINPPAMFRLWWTKCVVREVCFCQNLLRFAIVIVQLSTRAVLIYKVLSQNQSFIVPPPCSPRGVQLYCSCQNQIK